VGEGLCREQEQDHPHVYSEGIRHLGVHERIYSETRRETATPYYEMLALQTAERDSGRTPETKKEAVVHFLFQRKYEDSEY